MKRLFAAVALTMLALAVPAGAQQYPPAVNSLTVSDTTPSPGQTITIVGRTFAQGATVEVTLTSDPVVLGSAQADADGVAALEATIPADTRLGTHTISAKGASPAGDELLLSVEIEVVPAGAAGAGAGAGQPPAGDLPRTGDDSSLPLAKLGLGLAAVGGVITAVAAKRRKAAALAAG